MKIAIMQPYFFPYIGYFELIKSVDLFVFLDSQYKRGWINRNRIKNKKNTFYLTIPIKKHSRNSSISDIVINEEINWRKKHLHSLLYCYGKHIEDSLIYQNYKELTSGNLYEILLKTINSTCDVLKINTKFEESKNIKFEIINDTDLNNKENLVIFLCKYFKAKEYINLPGGINLYDKNKFLKHEIKLDFLNTNNLNNLSVLDYIYK